MKFTISRESLQKGVDAVAPVIHKKSTIPVLSNILIETTNTGIRFSGTDQDLVVRIEVPADIEEAGGLTVPAAKLVSIARELALGPVNMVSKGDQRLTITSGAAKFKLLGLPKDEFPEPPAIDFTTPARIQAADLHRLIAHTAFAVSTETSRPILNGMFWEMTAEGMSLVATNGHRLAKMTIPTPAITDAVIVPPKAFDQVRKIFDGEIEVARTANHVGFRSDTAMVSTRVLEGPYPNYHQVIPTTHDRTATMQKSALQAALRRMSTMSGDDTHRVRLSFGGDLLRLSVQTPDTGDATDEIPITYEGVELDIGFNGKYLLDILQYVDTERLVMRMKAPERAVVVEPLDATEPGTQLFLVMPLRLLD